jgi:hypothetical protein
MPTNTAFNGAYPSLKKGAVQRHFLKFYRALLNGEIANRGAAGSSSASEGTNFETSLSKSMQTLGKNNG